MFTGARSRCEHPLPRPARAAVALALAAAVLLGACGGDGGGDATDEEAAPTTTVAPTTTAAPINTEPGAVQPVMSGEEVCGLLSTEEVEEATDMATKPPFTGQAGQCTWLASEKENTVAAAIAVDRNGADNFERILRFEGSREITGLGDRALLNPTFFVVGAMKGTTYVQVQLNTFTDVEELEKVGRDLTEKVLAKV